MNNIKKLLNYQYDCLRQAIKSSSFNNLESCKDNQIILTDATEFNFDNSEIIDIMTRHALNQSTMSLLYSNLFIKGNKGKINIYTPLLYNEARLIRENDKIKLVKDNENILNIGVIANLMDGEEEKIELITQELMEVEACDLPKIMGGLLNMNGIEILKQNAIILAKLPDSTAGLLNELKQIANLY